MENRKNANTPKRRPEDCSRQTGAKSSVPPDAGKGTKQRKICCIRSEFRHKKGNGSGGR